MLLHLALALQLAAVVDLTGKAVNPLVVPAGQVASVLVFTTTDCPISNRYAPVIQELASRFEQQGIGFTLVYPVAADSPGVIREHVKTFAYSIPVVRDTAQELVKHTGARVTPEVAVIGPGGAVLYRGRIDDRYVDFGKGTRVSMEYTYDNSADNIRNPELPPAKVYWGQRSKDEMGDLWFQLLAANDRDRQLMRDQIATKMTVEDIAGYETMLRVDPADAELHDDVALLYMGVGQMAPAIQHFEATVSLKPDSAAARFNLGTALAQAGRLDEAIAAFRAALARGVDYALAHNNLGQVLLAQGKTGDALKHLQEAVRLDAANPQALFGLAEAYAAVGSFDLALEVADRALKLPLPGALAKQILVKREHYLQRRPLP